LIHIKDLGVPSNFWQASSRSGRLRGAVRAMVPEEPGEPDLLWH
jgi:hypothetical protein